MQKEVEGEYNTIINEIPEAERGSFTLDEFKQAWSLFDHNSVKVKKDNYIT